MSAYYNEHDQRAAAWLRELIAAGEIAPGVVDERSICDVRPDDLVGFTQCHFFAGIGGWSAALRLAGWPDDAPVWTGSCPCQPFSAAGKQLGTDDERHLWPALFRLIRECHPELVFGEQVASAIGKGWLDGISADMESENYACGAAVLGAHSVGAPHIRQRLFWVAYAGSERTGGNAGAASGAKAGGRGPWCKYGMHGSNNAGACGATGRLADRERKGLEGHTGDGDHRDEPGRLDPITAGYAATSGGTGGVGDTTGLRERSGADCAGGDGGGGIGMAGSAPRGDIEHRGEAGGLGDAASRGCGEQRDAALARSGGRLERAGGAGPGPWSDFSIIPCRDGKARRIPARPQPGILPLAYGLSDDVDAGWRQSDGSIHPLAQGVKGRVGILRGAGNAIVPELAALFIQASLDTLTP